MKRPFMTLLISTIGALALIGGVSTSASASTLIPSATKAPATQACWDDAATGQSACADSQPALALKLLNDYNVVLEGEVPSALKAPAAALSARAAARTTALTSNYLMATWYDGDAYTGDSWAHTTSATSNPCPSPGSYTYGDIPNLVTFIPLSGGWSDRISSYQGYNHCSLRLWLDVNFSGSSYGPVKYAPNLGAFNNQASSLDVQYVK
ncbi:hypothetical protein E3O55_09875 [Cryobacterium sp. MDB1-18-2]|uniref:hypothetical protein n=1 Tax=unclassified Cryobacterium TaxID=2649013 RepID=UPI001068D94B|nr:MULTISPECIES: hypothetical protein [unclassified Cryobacterium]TFC29173.1 hypothetical protein E3O55_09875 [Cryobacterium sp. MDB1-18-2]TFC45535.1 hypothetical protein E3O50_03545 [Cryobacterium sp. MDB1-18-1]